MSVFGYTPEALRAVVREEVIRVLSELLRADRARNSDTTPARQPPESRTLILLFTGSAAVSDQFVLQLHSLQRIGYEFAALFSHTFRASHNIGELIPKLPSALQDLTEKAEPDLIRQVQGAAGLLAESVSGTTAFKVVHGITDSAVSFVLYHALAAGKPVFVAGGPLCRLSFPGTPGSHPPIPVIRVYEETFHQLERTGARFLSCVDLIDVIRQTFTVPRNETPERLSRERPFPKREFVTVEDVWRIISRGESELVHAPDAVITDSAREYATDHSIALRPPAVTDH